MFRLIRRSSVPPPTSPPPPSEHDGSRETRARWSLNPVVTSREHRDDPGINRRDYIRPFTSGIPRSTVISGKCAVYSVVGVRLICASTQVRANRHLSACLVELFMQMVFLCIHGSAPLNLLCALPGDVNMSQRRTSNVQMGCFDIVLRDIL